MLLNTEQKAKAWDSIGGAVYDIERDLSSSLTTRRMASVLHEMINSIEQEILSLEQSNQVAPSEESLSREFSGGEEAEKYHAVMEQVQSLCADTNYFKGILDYMSDTENSRYEILEKVDSNHKVEIWPVPGYGFDHVFGWQGCHGEDCFYGEVWIPIPTGKFLKYWFSA